MVQGLRSKELVPLACWQYSVCCILSLAIPASMCAGECKYHVLGQEQGLAVGFMLLKVPVCHLDCCLNLEQLLPTSDHRFVAAGSRWAEQMWEVCWQCHHCHWNSASKGGGVASFCEKMNGKCEVMRMLQRTARKRNTYVLWLAI